MLPIGCECSFTTRALGDGCEYCNPELAKEMRDYHYEFVRDDFRDMIIEELSLGITEKYDLMADWHELAEYFTHE